HQGPAVLGQPGGCGRGADLVPGRAERRICQGAIRAGYSQRARELKVRHASRIAFFLAGLAFLASANVAAKTPPDTFVVASNISPMITPDPAAINETAAAGVMRNVCDALLALDPADASKVVPGVAESWTVSPDGKTYTLKIRKGLRFPSGNPVTGEDIVWA